MPPLTNITIRPHPARVAWVSPPTHSSVGQSDASDDADTNPPSHLTVVERQPLQGRDYSGRTPVGSLSSNGSGFRKEPVFNDRAA